MSAGSFLPPPPPLALPELFAGLRQEPRAASPPPLAR